ncbi:sialate O-acetylesterase [Rubrivirga marina]|uniref:Sialate O-acetylesterase domain-containing protein n=1 Tax=Rubrivirga marina TaxID=1196024 RepID=A0A271IV89_9BACT|nr:sialate O-acetylesterase [Rubrivirga marina]PAP75037.1 hypothetical protein BSZ37_00510 [Rubrivirga marina]
MRLSLLSVAAFALGALPAGAQEAPLHLGDLFHHHAVVQRDAPVPVWGTATPGETVAVELAGETAEAATDAEGHWSVRLEALPAGGPHTLTARAGGATATAEDVLVGDVFLCTGQSNMQFTVGRSTFGPFVARGMGDEQVRMLTVPNVSSPEPLEAFADTVAWEVATPETVPGWSAACAFFARDLRAGPLADVPVGLITSAWGGSAIRAWTPASALEQLGGYEADVEALRLYTTDERRAQQAFGATWEDWWRDRTGVAAGAGPWQPATGADWDAAPAGLGDWTQWDGLAGYTGMIWFRTTVTLTAEQAAQGADLALGAIDEVDQTWLNGQVVANTFGYGTERTYTIPAELLQEGENVVVVNVLNTYAAGGMTGDHTLRALHLDDGTRIPLTDWQYRVARERTGPPPRAPWESVGGLATIHNAMVAPLRNIGLRGVLWYQGESDTERGDVYEGLLRALIGGWRAQFTSPTGDPIPALIVQLPNYGPWPTAPGPSGWAEVREAQRLATVGDPFAATVVTIDVGDPRDLHPTHKQPVGARLARAARHVIYGEDVAPSGPVPVRAERRGDAVVVSFDDVEDGLVAYGGLGPIGFELCGADAESCRYVEARAEGSEVRIPLDGEPAARVRYAWADSPIVTLFDGADLPVVPFELSVQPAGTD